MTNILFLCTGNSCRSQMAEGFGKAFYKNDFHFFSAGTTKQTLNPIAVKVMHELKVDISQHTSKTLKDLPSDLKIDYVFTVCSDAQETCPYYPGAKIIHVGFDDPPTLTKGMHNEEEIFKVYCRVRDEIKEMVKNIKFYLEQSQV
jgi:arsenate reductase